MAETNAARMPDGLADEAVSDRFGRPTNARPAGANGTSWDAGFGLENFLEESEETASSRRPAVSSTTSLQRAVAHVRGTALAAAARLRLVMTSAGDRLSPTVRSRAPVSRWQVAIAALCVLGSAEAGWLGLRALRTTGASSEGRTATASGGPLPTTTQQGIPAREEGSTAGSFFSFAASTPAPGLARGSLVVSAAVPVQLFERGRLVGNSWSGGVRLTIGRHELHIVNRALGIEANRTVDIGPGSTASLSIDLPPGLVTIDASPWATVQVDGAAVGKTPLADLKLAPGPHEVLFSHPRLGQQRMTIAVLSGKPLQVRRDLRR